MYYAADNCLSVFTWFLFVLAAIHRLLFKTKLLFQHWILCKNLWWSCQWPLHCSVDLQVVVMFSKTQPSASKDRKEEDCKQLDTKANKFQSFRKNPLCNCYILLFSKKKKKKYCGLIFCPNCV